MLSPMSRAALVSSFTGGTESSEDVARAVTTVTTPAVATAAMARGPAKPARVPVKSVAAICAALMPAATAVRTPSRPPNVTVPAAMPRTRPGFSSTTPCIQPRTSAPTSYRPDIAGVRSSPIAIFSHPLRTASESGAVHVVQHSAGHLVGRPGAVVQSRSIV